MMDPFRLCVAMLPLALYLLGLAAVNFARRPVVVTGARDMAALGMAILGLLIVGPLELLMPTLPSEATGYYWIVLLLIYGLFLTLGVLLSAPRLVVYNVSLDQVRPVLSEVVAELDADARWAGGSVALPRLNIELHLDENPNTRNVSLVATSAPQSYSGWRQLEQALRGRLRETIQCAPNACGLVVLFAALAMAVRMGWIFYYHPREITQGFAEMMRF